MRLRMYRRDEVMIPCRDRQALNLELQIEINGIKARANEAARVGK